MHIPRYWAQTRLRHETGLRHGVTVQRWGWSDDSQAAADAHARERAQTALDALLVAPQQRQLPAGFQRLECVGEYGLNGETPIREEVLEQRGNMVMTRNSYGAHCLNTPDVAIADIDYPPAAPAPSLRAFATILVGSLIVSILVVSQSWPVLAWIPLAAAVPFLVRSILSWQQVRASYLQQTDPAIDALERVTEFSNQHPDWGLRLYSTPKGLRVIVTHQPTRPADAEVQALFTGLRVDPLYARLCAQQQCFRARVSGKPWRMQMAGPSPHARRWPVAAAHAAERQRWSEHYDELSNSYSACHFVHQLGVQKIAPSVQPLVDWHDIASRAHQPELSIA